MDWGPISSILHPVILVCRSLISCMHAQSLVGVCLGETRLKHQRTIQVSLKVLNLAARDILIATRAL
jgi:hypothetical protein